MKMLYVPNWEQETMDEVELIGDYSLDREGFVRTVRGLLASHSLFPVQARAELAEILKTRKTLLKAYDDSISLVYQINNRYSLLKGK